MSLEEKPVGYPNALVQISKENLLDRFTSLNEWHSKSVHAPYKTLLHSSTHWAGWFATVRPDFATCSTNPNSKPWLDRFSMSPGEAPALSAILETAE